MRRTQMLTSLSLASLCLLLSTSLAQAKGAKVDIDMDADEESSNDAKDGQDARPAANSTLIAEFTGPRAETIRKRVIKALSADGIALAPDGAQGDGELGDQSDEYVELSAKTGALGIVSGVVENAKGKWKVSFTVRTGKTGAIVGTPSVEAKALPTLLKNLDRRSTELLGEPLSQVQAAPPKKATAATTSLADADMEPPPEAEEELGQASSPFNVSLGLGFLQRNLVYSEGLADVYGFALVPHENSGLPMFVLQAQWYPGAHWKRGLLANIGIVVDYRQAFLASTGMHDGQSYDTAFDELLYGLRGRVPLNGAELGVALQFGRQGMAIEGDNEQVGPEGPVGIDPGIVPDIDYSLTRLGLDGALGISPSLKLYGNLGVRLASLASEPGQIAEERWFPKAAADGVDIQLGVEYSGFFDNVSAALNLDFRRYSIAMNTDADAALASSLTLNQAVAGGAIDQYLGASLLLRYTLEGNGNP